MNNQIDVSDLKVGARIRVSDKDLATIKYIGEVIIKTKKKSKKKPKFEEK